MGFFTVVLAMALAVSLRWPDVQAQECTSVSDLKLQFDQLSFRVERLSTELKSYRTALSKLKATELSIDGLTTAVTNLNDRLQEIEAEFSVIQQDFGAVNGTLSQHRAALSTLETEALAEIEELKNRQQGLQDSLRESMDEFEYELNEQREHFDATLESQRQEQTVAQNALRQEFQELNTTSEEREAEAEEQLKQVLADTQEALSDTSQESRVTALEALIASLEAQIQALGQQMTANQAGMQSIEQSVQNKAQQIGNLDNRLQTQQQEQDSVQGELQTVQNSLVPLESNTQDLEDQGTGAVGQLQTQGSRLDEQEQHHETLLGALGNLEDTFNQDSEVVEGRLTEAETRINTLETGAASAQDRITTIQSTVQTLGGTISTVEQQVDEQQSSLQTLQQNVDSQAEEIQTIDDSLQEAVRQQEELQQSYVGLQLEVQEQGNRTEARMRTIESGITTQGGSEGDISASLASLQATVAGLQTSLTEVNELGTGYVTDIETTQQTLDSYNQRIQDVETALDVVDAQALQQQISDYETSSTQRFGTVEANIATIGTSLTAVQSDIQQLEVTAGSVSGLSSQISQLNTQAQTNTQTLNSLEADMQQLQTNYETLSDQSEELESVVTTLGTGYQDVLAQLAAVASTQDIDDVRAQLVDLDILVDGLESDVQTMRIGSSAFQTDLRNDVNGITTTVQGHEVTINQLENNAGDDLTTTVNSLQSDVAGLTTTQTQLTPRITSATTSVSNHKNIVCESGEVVVSRQGTASQTSQRVDFTNRYTETPTVTVAVTLVDTASNTNNRVDVFAHSVTTYSAWITLRSWSDTYVYGLKARWLACG